MASRVLHYAPSITEAARKYKIPPSMLAGLIQVESAGNPRAVSSAGAFGLTQFMPGTAPSYGVKRGTSRSAKRSQIFGAAKYLVQAGYRKNPRKALSAYVAGAGGGRQPWYEKRVLDASQQFRGLNKRQPSTKQMVRQAKRKAGLTTTKTKTTTVTPGVNNEPLRQQLKQTYLQQRGKPTALLELASGLAEAKDIPGTTKTVSQVVRGAQKGAKAPSKRKGGLRLGESRSWGGAQGVSNLAVNVAKRHGVPVTSRKRSYNTVSGGVSDHYTGARNSYAVDLGTNNGAGLAKAIARAYGIKGNVVGTYQRHPVTVNGHRYSVQILWGVQGHHDHVHVGIKRV